MAEREPEQNRKISPGDQNPSFAEVMGVFGPALEGEAFRKIMEAGGIIEFPGFTIASEETIRRIQEGEVLPPKDKE